MSLKTNLLAVIPCLLFISSVVAQSDDELKREFQNLKNKVEKLEQQNAAILNENARMRAENSDLRDSSVSESVLEEHLNALSESWNYDTAAVESGANKIVASGHARVRSGYTSDRDFGLQSDNDVDDDGTFMDANFIVGFTYHLDRNVTAHFGFQAVGILGDGQTVADTSRFGNVDVDTAWIDIDKLFGRDELSMRVGRQTVVRGNEFQFGDNDYFAGETLDGAIYTWENKSFSLDLMFFKAALDENSNTFDHPYRVDGNDSDGFDDDEIWSLYFTLKTINNAVLDLYWIYFNGENGATNGTNGNNLGAFAGGNLDKGSSGGRAFYHTIGGRFAGTIDSVAAGLDYGIEIAYQFGDLKESFDSNVTANTLAPGSNPGFQAGGGGNDTDVDGLAIELELGITFNAKNNFRVFTRFLYAQGAEADEVEVLDAMGNVTDTFLRISESGYIPLFTERQSHGSGSGHTARRARYGLMNIVPVSNVLAFNLGIHFDPNPDWTIGFNAIYAIHDEDVPTGVSLDAMGNATGIATDDGIGLELDLWADYRFSEQTTFSFAVAVFFPEDGAPLKTGGGTFNASDFAGSEDDTAILLYSQVVINF